jgi:hypothetical protein
MWPHNLVAISVFLATAFNVAAIAKPGGDWSKTPQEVREWIARQKQPDNPAFCCCGEADAYFADAYEVVDGKVFATITDDRDDFREMSVVRGGIQTKQSTLHYARAGS